MKKILTIAALAAATQCAPLMAHDGEKSAGRADSHAPIGVKQDHFHKKGEMMASYRFMSMKMDEPASMMGAQQMRTNMHMVGMMWAPSDKLTLAAMTSFADRRMDMTMMMGGTTTAMQERAKDFGDIKVVALVPLYDSAKNKVLISGALNIPTGSTSDLRANGMMAGTSLPLSMQAGSGSWGFAPSITVTHYEDKWSAGSQLQASFMLDDASTGDRLGNKWHATSWAAYRVGASFSLSARVSYAEMEPLKSEVTFSTRKSLRGFVGVNYLAQKGALKGHRVALEFGMPIKQKTGGAPLKQGNALMLGWQKAW